MLLINEKEDEHVNRQATRKALHFLEFLIKHSKQKERKNISLYYFFKETIGCMWKRRNQSEIPDVSFMMFELTPNQSTNDQYIDVSKEMPAVSSDSLGLWDIAILPMKWGSIVLMRSRTRGTIRWERRSEGFTGSAENRSPAEWDENWQ